jgi:hypothetical protein
MERTPRMIMATLALAGGLAGCQSKFQGGENGIATKDIKVTENYDQAKIDKDFCYISEGDPVTVGERSSVREGANGEFEPVIKLINNDCTGWAYDDSSLNDKIK